MSKDTERAVAITMAIAVAIGVTAAIAWFTSQRLAGLPR